MKPVTIRLERYDAGNEYAARIILSNPEKFGGEHAGLVRCSRAVLARLGQKRRANPHDSVDFEQFSGRFAARQTQFFGEDNA